nr:MAG TPA: hypothetical protein [Caudoviricetes sp.]DAJ44630.1 MAG TPA: hypothetical protein [Caudoviricetes sp.]DAP84529.1 MAG TPA: hypothetical protein [Caudoviricetes sp.]DAY79123.1 MAG TPA: hypothetical protein [Caudoviricetes sp.]
MYYTRIITLKVHIYNEYLKKSSENVKKRIDKCK